MERLPAAATAAIAALFIGRVRPPQPPEYDLHDLHDLHNLHELRKTKCALDKLRFELTLYGFFSKEETDLIISIVWRSWPPNGGLDDVRSGSPKGSPLLTSS